MSKVEGVPSDDGTPVISYARISDDGENDQHGVRDQHKVNRATAKRLGMQVVLELTDNDRSASKAEVVREDFERMVKLLRAGRCPDGTPVEGVVVVADDRLARRAGDYERFVEALTSKDGRVYADERGKKDLYSEDVEGLGLVGVAFSKIESRKIRRRIKRWHRARAEDGKQPGGTRPFGWRKDDRSKLDPAEAPLLAKAVDEVIAGRSLNSIINEWRKLGILTSLGNQWTAISLKLALDNPRICGWRRMGSDLVLDEHGQPVVGLWRPIVSPEKWLAVHAVFEARRGKLVNRNGIAGDLPSDFREHKHLLTGILRCGRTREDGSICGAKLRVTSNRDCVQHIYACPPKTAGGCGGLGRRGDLVDEYITEAVLAKLEERNATAARETTPWLGEAELHRLEGKLGTLKRQWTSSEITDEFFFGTVREIEQSIKELRNEQGRHTVAAARAQATFTGVRQRWLNGDLDTTQKRAYIREALLAVIVLPAGKGRAPFNPDLLIPKWRG
ncbi:recombinase family protein [Longispora albida]|uniref:recombinase family protein n=1 Tax=Longispora albida TaxID=203523 RepID=UPI00146BA061|nr:recombinase family protein [Longispora albida]